jgi:DNA-binding response OmpR family regulator
MSRLHNSDKTSRTVTRRRALLHVGDARLLRALEGALIADGWAVETARGRRALVLIAERWPDVVVGDTWLAEIDPLRVLLDAAHRGIPVALCVRVGEASRLDPELVGALGRHVVVPLPAPIAELRDRVSALLPASRPAVIEESGDHVVAALRPAALEASP